MGPALGRACAGEVIGTYLLAFFGCGAVLSAVITGAQVGLWQVAVVWGFGISLAIYATATTSGAHLNPAVTLSVAIIISVLAPLTQAGLNPARDVGPRLFALLAGWGAVALPGPNGVWWADIVGPLPGGPVGATLYDRLIRTTPPQAERAVVSEETAVP